jgi:hypothetical protein
VILISLGLAGRSYWAPRVFLETQPVGEKFVIRGRYGSFGAPSGFAVIQVMYTDSSGRPVVAQSGSTKIIAQGFFRHGYECTLNPIRSPGKYKVEVVGKDSKRIGTGEIILYREESSRTSVPSLITG